MSVRSIKPILKFAAAVALLLAVLLALVVVAGHELFCGFDRPCDHCLFSDNSKNWLPDQCAQQRAAEEVQRQRNRATKGVQ